MIFRMAPEANIRDAGYAVRGTLRYRHRGRVFVQAVCSTEPNDGLQPNSDGLWRLISFVCGGRGQLLWGILQH